MPNNGNGNLSKKGKIYTTKPRFKWYEIIHIIIPYSFNEIPSKGKNRIIADYFITGHYNSEYYNRYFKTNENDWEIIEFNYEII